MARIKNVPSKVKPVAPPKIEIQNSSSSTPSPDSENRKKRGSLSTSHSMSPESVNQSSPETEPIRGLDFLYSEKPPLLYLSTSEPVSQSVSPSATLPVLYSNSHPEYPSWITNILQSHYQPGMIPDLTIRIQLEEQTGLNRRQIYSWYRRKRKSLEKKNFRDTQFKLLIKEPKTQDFFNACFQVERCPKKELITEISEATGLNKKSVRRQFERRRVTPEQKEERNLKRRLRRLMEKSGGGDSLHGDEDVEMETVGTLLSLKNGSWEERSGREHPPWITNQLLEKYEPGIMPSLEERKELANGTGLMISKVSNWFRHKNRSEEDKIKKREYMKSRRDARKDVEEEMDIESLDLEGVIVFGRTLSTDIEDVTDN